MRIRPDGWQPGQDASGIVLKAAADGRDFAGIARALGERRVRGKAIFRVD
jgi:hypothetical protein